MQTRDRHLNSLRALMARFARDESGGIIILTLVLLTVMLVMGGMAVDFMRYEAQRAQLQSVSDRAVLAAAELDQTLDGEAVVVDFFEKAGLEETIIGTPSIQDTGNSRTVRVNSAIDVNTFYLRLIGIDQLNAPAQSAATEGVGKVEISLVIDISGSMRYGGSSSRGRFGDMQDAAIAFANKVLDPKYDGQVSLNIVPYAGATNPGRPMFNFLKGVGVGTVYDDDGDPLPDHSSCLEMAPADWETSGLPGQYRDQVPVFMRWAIEPSVMDWGWCPQDKSSIQYGIKNAADAATFINGIRMHDGTGTHYGMKWGLAALDPNTQPAFAYLAKIDTDGDGIGGDIVPAEFVNRPAAWDDPETRKIIVLMTDGKITEQVRPDNPLDPENYEKTLSSGDRFNLTSRSENVKSFYAICDLAKSSARDVEVYTVAFETDSNGQTEMRNCASDPSMYFPASGSGLTDVFEDIADQITDLRLSL